MGFFGSTGRRSACFVRRQIDPVPDVGGYVLPLGAIGCREESRKSLKQRPHMIDFFMLGCGGHAVMLTYLWC